MQMNDATRAQIAAARPDQSTWLGANAGSGKTRVLTNRVARLLLSGVKPQNILCLTYTKAAAGEMQNRLFQTLGGWAMKSDAELRAELAKLGEAEQSGDDLRQARRLFARAIETPGGLKIQTIHSFCAALLRRFPLEAGVSPQFKEMDDRTTATLIETVVEAMADGPDAPLLDALAAQMAGEDMVAMGRDILSRRAALVDIPDQGAVYGAFGLPDHPEGPALVQATFAPGDMDLLVRLLPVLQAGGTNDRKAAAKLAGLGPLVPSVAMMSGLEDILLTGATAKVPFGPKIGKFPTKAGRDALGPDGCDALDGLMARIGDARDQRVALKAAEQTLVLHRFAAAFLPRIEAAKRLRGWLDFDDLILRSRALLTDPAVAQWVLYKLDGGIDHILVDEAQDTSPAQWDVIRLLAQEFTAGETGKGERTIFVVGDQKQSIYSFQGADPREFDRMRGHFSDGLAQVDKALHDRDLAHSFRSAPAVLAAVDATFPGASGLGQASRHIAFKDHLPGCVDLWPAIPSPAKEKGRENAVGWDPIDRINPESAQAQLAQQVAQKVRDLVDRGHLPDGEGKARRIHEGDVLILFRRRSELFFECMRALKGKELEVAGADRIQLGEELAVRDLLALLRFLALPEDDLSLAAALRSPLFGWSEDALFRLAHWRPEKASLWQALRQGQPDADTGRMLDDLRKQTDFLRPFDLLDRILTRHQGRSRMIARLGGDCEEAIDGLLQQALDYESAEVPSLTGFLEWMDAEDVALKRQAEGAGRRVRLMTVHGSKGLEAPIVILPDCGPFRSQNRDRILDRPGGWPAWKPVSREKPKALAEAFAAAEAVENEERDRLLYVAMTRAEQWLIAGAAGDLGKQTSWHSKIESGLRQAGARELPQADGTMLRLQSGDWSKPIEVTATVPQETAKADLPDWVHRHATKPDTAAKTIAPSSLGGAKALPGEGADEETALRIGRQMHLLLEHLPHLPAPAWQDAAPQILTREGDATTAEETEALLSEATTVLTHPELAPLFTGSALAEVPLSVDTPELDTRLHGIIDRLVIGDDHILAIDFKTNRTVPESVAQVPEGLLRQMGAYAAALTRLYPNHRIETALLWTRTATLLRLPHAHVMAALQRAASTS